MPPQRFCWHTALMMCGAEWNLPRNPSIPARRSGSSKSWLRLRPSTSSESDSLLSYIRFTMRAFEIQEFGLDNLKIVERETPAPGFGEVLVRLTAASLNFRDLMVAEGTYNPKLKRPMVPLSDGAGV